MALFADSASRSMRSEISDLSTELARLARRISDSATDAGSSAGGWLASGAPSRSDMREAADDGAAFLWREAGRAWGGAKHEIRRRPATAALALVGIGLLLGLMARR